MCEYTYSKELTYSCSTISHDSMILTMYSAFDGSEKFEKATSKQRELAVTTSIKSFVSYLSALEALNLAASSCDTNTQRALNAWDGGAALLIGSAEGKEGSSVNRTSEGWMFFSISNELCPHFDTCTEDGSTVTDELIALLISGQGLLNDLNTGSSSSLCPALTDTLQSIVRLCSVALIQNLIYYAEESSDDNTGAGFIASMSVLPFVSEFDPEAASTIKKEMRFRKRGEHIDTGAVLVAFQTILSNPSSDIDCDTVSRVHSLCNPSEIPASVNLDEPSILSNGLYTATSYVTDRSTISLDIRFMEEKIKANHMDDAIALYKAGENSPTYNAIGQLTGKRSVSKFSTDAPSDMITNPIYNHFMFGLSDSDQGTAIKMS